MNKLQEYLNELETTISHQETFKIEISKSNVGWHIEHILLTITKILDEVHKSKPEKYKWSFKLPRIIVFSLNKIPRGRAKSPEVVVPKYYNENTLSEHLKTASYRIQSLEKLSPDKYFNHPFFGNLKLYKTIQFLQIHTNHHLEIINDILKK